MQSFIPDSVSPDELLALLKQDEPELEPADLHDQLWSVANRHLTAMFEELPDPLVHKVAALIILRRLADFHAQVAEMKRVDDEPDALHWASDATTLEHAWMFLKQVGVGDNDPYTD